LSLHLLKSFLKLKKQMQIFWFVGKKLKRNNRQLESIEALCESLYMAYLLIFIKNDPFHPTSVAHIITFKSKNR
jgi:hypothetical protein